MHKLLGLIVFFVVATLVAAGVSPLLAADFREECLNRLGVLEKKVVELAEAIPAGKYAWRPTEGVRSVSEVYLHIAALNFASPRALATPPPEGFSYRGYDTSTTDKAEIVSRVKESFAHIRNAWQKVSAADADKTVKMFRAETTTRNAMWSQLEHLSEHLGQSIAYARMNGVTPPWSMGGGMGMD